MFRGHSALILPALALIIATAPIFLDAQTSPQAQQSAQPESAAQAAAKPVLTPVETAIAAEMKTLRNTPDAQRGAKTSAIALEIAALPADRTSSASPMVSRTSLPKATSAARCCRLSPTLWLRP